ncbi:MAG: hypothetical protein ABI977_14270 [Acidobacteriota bacterium]
MARSKSYDYMLERFRGFLGWLINPFTDENGTLETYSKRGYYALGLFLAVVILALWVFGGLNFTVGELASDNGVDLAKKQFKGIFLGFVKPIPILLVPFVIYFYGLIRKKWREQIGKRFIDLVIGILDWAISVAERSLVNRTKSVLVFSGLIALVTAGLLVEVDWRSRSMLRENDFMDWLKNADDFVCHSTLTQFEEAEEYKDRVQAVWDGKLALTPNAPVRLALRELLETLYPKAAGQTAKNSKRETWSRWLSAREKEIEKTCHRCKPPTVTAIAETRAWILLNLMKGRIQVQLSHGCGSGPCPYLAKAKSYFTFAGTAAENAPLPDDLKKRYECAVGNGLGTVYAEAMKLYLSNKEIDLSAPPLPMLTEDQPEASRERVERPCKDAENCGDLAYDSYKNTCTGFSGCRFEYRRRENNLADFLVKYSRAVFHDAKLSPRDTELAEWVKSSDRMAVAIETQLGKSINCSAAQPFVPALFVTAAEGYATCASLRKAESGRVTNPTSGTETARGEKLQDDLDAAFLYLNLAYTFDSANLNDWNLQPFCLALNDEQVDKWLMKKTVKGLRPFGNDQEQIAGLMKACRKSN